MYKDFHTMDRWLKRFPTESKKQILNKKIISIKKNIKME